MASQTERQRFAAEVLRLGQDLFDSLITTVEQDQGGGGNEEGERVPVDELRQAAGEFFAAVQLLLGLDEREARGLVGEVERKRVIGASVYD